MFENRHLTVFEGKCHWFRNSSECFKTHWRQWLTNLDANGAKTSVKMWTTNFYKSFSKNILLYMSSRLSKIRSLHMYVMIRTVYFGWIRAAAWLLLLILIFFQTFLKILCKSHVSKTCPIECLSEILLESLWNGEIFPVHPHLAQLKFCIAASGLKT